MIMSYELSAFSQRLSCSYVFILQHENTRTNQNMFLSRRRTYSRLGLQLQNKNSSQWHISSQDIYITCH